jgi:hypothetical protein
MRRKAKPSRHKKHWSKSEIKFLEFYWGVFTINTIAMRLNRTPEAIVEKSKSIKLGSPGRGLMCLAALSRYLGYDPRTIRCAAVQAGIQLDAKRLPAMSRGPRGFAGGKFYGFDEDDADAIMDIINKFPPNGRINNTIAGEWNTGTKPAQCLDCGRSDRPHSSRGLCEPCRTMRRRNGIGFKDRPPVKRVNWRKKTRS